jgi:hypothetical protein
LALSFSLGCGTSCGKLLHQHCSEASCHHCPWWFTLTIGGQRHLGFKLIPEVAEFSGGLFQMGHMLTGSSVIKWRFFSRPPFLVVATPRWDPWDPTGRSPEVEAWYGTHTVARSILLSMYMCLAQGLNIAGRYWMLLDAIAGTARRPSCRILHGFSRPYAPVLFSNAHPLGRHLIHSIHMCTYSATQIPHAKTG